MNRVWLFRIAGLVLLLVFVLLLVNLHRRLVTLQRERPAAAQVDR